MPAIAAAFVALLLAHDFLMPAGPVSTTLVEPAALPVDHPHTAQFQGADHDETGYPSYCSTVHAATAVNARDWDDLSADRSAGVVVPCDLPGAVLVALVSSPSSSLRPASRAMLQVWRI